MKKIKSIFILSVILLSTVLFFSASHPTSALLQTRSNTLKTMVGTPPKGSDNNIAEVAEDMANALLKNCPATIELNKDNISCIKDHLPPSVAHPEEAYAELIASVNSEVYLQCVGFVQAVSAAVTGQRIENRGIVNYASEYATSVGYVSPQYTFIDKKNGTMEPGDFPVWAGPPGHIAVVVEIYDANNFRIAEANLGYKGQVSVARKLTVDDTRLLGWLRLK